MTKFSWTDPIVEDGTVTIHLNSYRYSAKLFSAKGVANWFLYIDGVAMGLYNNAQDAKIDAERLFLSEKPLTYFWERVTQKGVFRKLAYPKKTTAEFLEKITDYEASQTANRILNDEWFTKRHTLDSVSKSNLTFHIQTIVKHAVLAVQHKGYTLAECAPSCIYVFSIEDKDNTYVRILVDVKVCHQWESIEEESKFKIRVTKDGGFESVVLANL